MVIILMLCLAAALSANRPLRTYNAGTENARLNRTGRHYFTHVQCRDRERQALTGQAGITLWEGGVGGAVAAAEKAKTCRGDAMKPPFKFRQP